jgi:hypothetical protein
MTTGRRPRFDPDLAETLDESPSVIVETPGGEVSDEPTEQAGWQVLRDLRADVTEAKGEALNARDEARAVKRKLDRAEKVVYSGAGLIGIGAIAVIKLAFASGDRTATDRQMAAERAEQREATRALQLVVVPELRAATAANSAAIAGLRGALDAINRLGAVRVHGPAPKPLLPDGDP